MKRMRDVSYKRETRTRRRRSAKRLGDTATLESRVAEAPLRLRTRTAKPKTKKQTRRAEGGLTPVRVVGLAIVLIGVWLIYTLFGKDTYYVYGADIQGNMVLDSAEIYRAAGIDRTSIFWINPHTVQQNIEALKYVNHAEVSVKLPAEVHITVTERLPQVLWRSGSEMYWVDAEGVFLPAKAEAVATGIELQIEEPEGGTRENIDPRIIRAAQRVYRFKPEVNHLYFQHELGLIYPNAHNWPVYLGKDDANISAKLQVADALEASLASKGITPKYIDVRDPQRAYYAE